MFVTLYLTTLIINIGVNSGIITFLGEGELFLTIAFLMSTGTSATLNFIGMQAVVFKSKQRIDL